MSMFHELMMRKKEEIMYATIKGSLTESPDGIFSGFSASNYLKLQQQFKPADKNWEIVIKTEITQLNVVQTIIGSSTNSNNIQLAIRDTNIIRFYRTTNGTTDAITNSSLTIDSLGVYYFKISFNGSQYKVSVSQDGNNYIDYITTTSSTLIYNNSPRLALGVNGRQMSTEYLRGSIDLNGSYFKIGSTKYNLQAVVGYTIVGSPTITDGVVSGFTSFSPYAYLQTASNFPLQPNSFEMVFKLKYDTSYSGVRYFAGGENRSSFILGITYVSANTFKFRMYAGNSTGTGAGWNKQSEDVALNENDWIFVKYMFDGQEYSMWVSENGITYTKIVSYSSSTLLYGNAPINIGLWTVHNEGVCFKGEIDMNETYIKINNKLWFNGQQA